MAVLVALIGMGLLCYSAPWHQVDADGAEIRSLGYAPSWSSEFNYTPGAKVDSEEFFLFAIVIFFVAFVAGLCTYIIYGPPWWRRANSRR
jgi:hypothetical protein